MNKPLKTILVFGIIAGIMLFTCPKEEKHVDKIAHDLTTSFYGYDNNNDDPSLLESIGNAVTSTIGESLALIYVESQLKVDNYLLLNVGKIYFEGKELVVSIGMFGHVFCLVKIYERLGKNAGLFP